MTSSAIRQSFLDFFQEKQHTIVPSSSLLPDSPNLLFTNAGMNQFVPIFLGQAPCPYTPARAADTQKCIRAGGKHNDLEDVGFDTYHHTFFEMLGNWSFGDYFKKEAIAWAWELVVGRWNFPASRLYATVYSPGPGDPASFDQEAYDYWAAIFTAAGLDPAVHIVHGNKKDNFWMMGDTGPCGPCSELHVNLLPGPRDPSPEDQASARALVNSGDARCIEIWNLVFIQFNANPDGTFVDLPAKHVDTGMGFERVTSMIQGTNGLTDFSRVGEISNYNTDVFRPIFDELEKLTGKTYGSTLPKSAQDLTEQEKIDVAFRVIADHIRTLSFSIAGEVKPGAGEIPPSNESRGYVLRRILRRAVKYGRNLGLREPFMGKLVAVLGVTMGHIFPEVVFKADLIRKTLTNEEESFLRTLERGIELFENQAQWQLDWIERCKGFEITCKEANWDNAKIYQAQNLYSKEIAAPNQASFHASIQSELNDIFLQTNKSIIIKGLEAVKLKGPKITGKFAFKLSDTYGFPLDLTELMARERGFVVEAEEYNRLMEEQRERSRSATIKTIVEVFENSWRGRIDARPIYENPVPECVSTTVASTKAGTKRFLPSALQLYPAMGGQVSDHGYIEFQGLKLTIVEIHKVEDRYLIDLNEPVPFSNGDTIEIHIDAPRRARIEAHHSGTHVLNWALRKVLGNTISQKGSYVGPDRLRFDFSHGAALTPAELAEVERLVNAQIIADVPASWEERPYTEVKGDPNILQAFGDKYGDTVRVVSIGDFSKELCGGTHVRQSGKIGYFKILSEGAIAAGIRRIEAVSGVALSDFVMGQLDKQDAQLDALKLRKPDLSPLPSALREQSVAATWQLYAEREAALARATAEVVQHEKDAAKNQEAAFQKRAAETAPDLIAAAREVNGVPFLAVEIADAPAAYLPVLADALKNRWQGVAVLATADQGKVALLAAVAPSFTKKIQAGKIIQAIAPLVGGKGGGRPELAQGGGTNPAGLAEALVKAGELMGAA